MNDPWYFALVAIDPSSGLYAEAFDASLYFYHFTLQKNTNSGRNAERTPLIVVIATAYPYTKEVRRWEGDIRELYSKY